jgi:hypothetical protein
MDRRELIYHRLMETACAEKTVTYADLASLIGLEVEKAEDRADLVHILEDIAYLENAAGRPLLTAVVVRPEIPYPGPGFFLQARELGFNYFDDERSYYWYELKRVYAYWKMQAPAIQTVPYMVVNGYEIRVAAA